MPTLTLRIPTLPMSANKRTGAHHMVLAREKRRLHQLVWVALNSNRLAREAMTPAAEPRRVTITLHHTGQAQDPDNAVASCKPLIDCLTELKLIKDDAAECLIGGAVVVRQVKSQAKKTVIEVSTETEANHARAITPDRSTGQSG